MHLLMLLFITLIVIAFGLFGLLLVISFIPEIEGFINKLRGKSDNLE
jgi:polyferredoxin